MKIALFQQQKRKKKRKRKLELTSSNQMTQMDKGWMMAKRKLSLGIGPVNPKQSVIVKGGNL